MLGPFLLATAMTSTPSSPTLAQFEAVLARHDSATLALEEWCALRGLAAPASITARSTPESDIPASDNLRAHLAPTADETIALRHVELRCGATILSVAWNWYVPQRLTPDMNTILATTDRPFGKVVAPLSFRREPIERVLGPADNCPVDTISTHRARLILPDGRPFSYLVECYTPANLAPAPQDAMPPGPSA